MNDQIREMINVQFGCDPEIFLTRGGQVIGAERVIPEEGLNSPSTDPGSNRLKSVGRKGIVLDGVQVELNPSSNTCRALLGDEISAAFKTLKAHLSKLDGVSANFTQVVDVDPKELEGLSEKAKALGCAPSKNIYDRGAQIGVNPATYTKRSAGGHIHLGLTQTPTLLKERERLVPLLDVLVGNTAVLMDRHPGNRERRKVYGRAGEHRLPDHGLEYRTLSNFWLHAYPLMSGVMGLSKLAVCLLSETLGTFSKSYQAAEHDLLQAVDMEAIIRAINENDLQLAKQNWKVVRDYLSKHTRGFAIGLNHWNLDAFDYFVSKIDTDGLAYWFPDDPMLHWTDKYGKDGHGVGWESFLDQVDLERTGKGTYHAR